jgi:hypothetical protein
MPWIEGAVPDGHSEQRVLAPGYNLRLAVWSRRRRPGGGPAPLGLVGGLLDDGFTPLSFTGAL